MPPKRKGKKAARRQPKKDEAYVYEKVGYKGMFTQFKIIYFRPGGHRFVLT